MDKKAERPLSDADKFPRESFRERLSRRYGIDAVALSGPCEGQPLVDCIVDQLEGSWGRIRDRFAGNVEKATKLAMKMAESQMERDDTQKCAADLVKQGYSKEAAAGIAGYLKAYAVDKAAQLETDKLIDEVANEPGDGFPPPPAGELKDLGEPVPGDLEGLGELDGLEGPGEEVEEIDDLTLPPEGESPFEEEAEPETVSVDIPIEVAEDIAKAVEQAHGGVPEDLGAAGAEGTVAPEVPEELVDVEIAVPEVGEPNVEETVEEVVPGEPDVGGGKQFVETDKAADDDGKKADDMGKCADDDGKKADDAGKCADDDGKKLADDDKKADDDGKKMADAKTAQLKATKVATEIRKLGPEMALNNTDQLGGHSGKQLGTAKEKDVEAPKPVPDNMKPEGFVAGGTKVQDGKTLGREQKFDAKELDKGATTGGQASLMGKDESLPKGGPSVPGGSAPIGGEQFDGGNVATKGTVIATITPEGVEVEGQGKKYMAKGAISKDMVPAVEAALGKIPFEGDVLKYAKAAFAAIKSAATKCEDGVTKTDNSKLEGERFTNDAEKKAEGETAPKGGKTPAKDEGVTKTDTGKLEKEKFTNDGEKKPEKAAASEKTVKTARPIEDPKPVQENMKPEGFVAGGTKVQDGKTLGNEPKFDPKTVEKSDVSKGSASEMGKTEEFPVGKADVPAGGGKMGNEPWEGDNLSTKGTTIAAVEEMKSKMNDLRLENKRLMHASFYVADLLRNGEISESEYQTELEKTAAMSVPQIQNLIASTKKARARVVAAAANGTRTETKEAGLSIPVVVQGENRGQDLKDKIIANMSLTKKLDSYEAMKANEKH